MPTSLCLSERSSAGVYEFIVVKSSMHCHLGQYSHIFEKAKPCWVDWLGIWRIEVHYPRLQLLETFWVACEVKVALGTVVFVPYRRWSPSETLWRSGES